MPNLITNYMQADPAPKLKTREVSTPEITKGGKPADWIVAQVYNSDYVEWSESTEGNNDVRWLQKCLQDGHGNCIFPTVEKAAAFFEGRSRSAILPLVIAANELNFSTTVEDAEKNSEPTTTDDSPSNSA